MVVWLHGKLPEINTWGAVFLTNAVHNNSVFSNNDVTLVTYCKRHPDNLTVLV